MAGGLRTASETFWESTAKLLPTGVVASARQPQTSEALKELAASQPSAPNSLLSTDSAAWHCGTSRSYHAGLLSHPFPCVSFYL